MFEVITPLMPDPSLALALLVGVAVLATLYTLLPLFGEDPLKARMRTVALQREELRARRRARLAGEAEQRRRALREHRSAGMSRIVERLDLRRLLVDEATVAKLREAGFRGQDPLTRFLFFRLTLPIIGLAVAIGLVFGLDVAPTENLLWKGVICIVGAYVGFYTPVLYVTNLATKRRTSILKAWPDALDLMLICVESGVSVESALRRVAEEIGVQSVPLAGELMLTNAELSFLEHRRQAYENLASRTGLESVKNLCQALIQAERYGTPISKVLRVLADESRDMRMNAAEKKAAALPPKMTVPMILFFLPVLFIIILGPAGIEFANKGLF